MSQQSQLFGGDHHSLDHFCGDCRSHGMGHILAGEHFGRLLIPWPPVEDSILLLPAPQRLTRFAGTSERARRRTHRSNHRATAGLSDLDSTGAFAGLSAMTPPEFFTLGKRLRSFAGCFPIRCRALR